MDSEIEIELKKLILDDDFTSIQSLVSEEINLMSILNVESKELQHSNLLAWLFAPNESHGLGDYFIKEFIKLYYKENEYQDLGNQASKLSVFDFVNLDFSDLEIRREYKNIDLLILSESNGLCIMIENKIHAKESKGQLAKYRNIVETEFSHYKYKIYIYLSLLEQEISEAEFKHYVLLTYEHIKNILEQIVGNRITSIENNTSFVLRQYLQTLKSLMNENEKIEKTALELYKKYKPAFDLVYKYASPQKAIKVPNNIVELIKKNTALLAFQGNKRYIRFQPKFLYENINKLKHKGLIDVDEDLKTNWLFLFEFHVTEQTINFDFKIGNYPNQESRKKLYALYSKHKIFNCVSNRKLSPSWHLSFQRKIISSSEYKTNIKKDDDSLNKLIEKNFNDLISKDLPKLLKVIDEYIQ